MVQGLIRERSELLATVERLSRTDALTGVLNRRAWEEMIQDPIARTARTADPITLAILGNLADTPETRKAAADEAVAISTSGKYTRVPIEKTMPVYITYFTMGVDIEGKLRAFNDLYGRDAPVLTALDAPRQANRARKTDEEVIEIVDDLQTT